VRATGLEYVCLARHGQTEWNQQGRRQGHLDSPLTPSGVLQAERNADLIATRLGLESYADADRRAGEALRWIEATGARRPLVASHRGRPGCGSGSGSRCRRRVAAAG
jgi:broad specificity phosphatase PhoE